MSLTVPFSNVSISRLSSRIELRHHFRKVVSVRIKVQKPRSDLEFWSFFLFSFFFRGWRHIISQTLSLLIAISNRRSQSALPAGIIFHHHTNSHRTCSNEQWKLINWQHRQAGTENSSRFCSQTVWGLILNDLKWKEGNRAVPEMKMGKKQHFNVKKSAKC